MENPNPNQKTESRNSENGGILDCWQALVSGRGGQTAVLSPAGEAWRTFSEVENEARRWADRLQKSCAGLTISLQTGNVAEWPALILGIWYAGKTALPLDLDLGPERRAEVEKLCGVAARIEKVSGNIELVPLQNSPVSWPVPKPVLLKLTSGTSAAPRVIRFTAAQLIADCAAICATMGLREEDRNYGVISFAHSYGFSNLITPLLCRGIALVVAADMIPQAVKNGLSASKATVFPGVPALFRALSGLEPGDLDLRLCISAGAPLSREVAIAFHAQWGRKVHTFYGSSECGGICYDAGGESVSQTGYVGFPMQGVELQRISEDWPSQVEVRSAAVGEGYHPSDPDGELTDRTFRPSDILTEGEAGYVITGRASDLINVSGRKVNPSEIESALLRYPGVREVVVVGLPEGFRGEEVAACVVGDATEEKLRHFCGTVLPAWQVPRRWVFVDALPMNVRGKISRPAIRLLF